MAGSMESLPRPLMACTMPAGGDALSPQTSREPLIGTTSGSNLEVAAAATEPARTNQRTDVALLPLLSLLYLFNGLDRGNIGNAQTQGFTDDIGCQPDDLNLAVSLFYLPFVLLQPFSALVGGWLGAEHWIPVMMFSWGGVTLAQTFIRGRRSLIVTRLLVGALEAGFYPTATAYLALFYHPYDLATRLAWFYGQYAVASAFSGAMAYGIFQIQHPVLKPWQFLFIIQGSLTCLLAIAAWVWLPAGPGTAWFLSEQQRAWTLKRTQAADSEEYTSGVTWRDLVETVRDWKVWFVLVCNICASVPSTAFSVFLPLVVQGMGYSSVEANLMAVPPAVCGALGLWLFAWSSDRRGERGHHIVAAIAIAAAGLVAVVTVSTSRARYAALCVFLFGSYVSAPLTTAWLSGNTPAPGKRVVVLGVNGWGNLAGVIGSQLYRAEYAPAYQTPFYATLAFVVAAMAGYLGYRFALQAVNRRRASILRSKPMAEIERRDRLRYADRKWTCVYGL